MKWKDWKKRQERLKRMAADPSSPHEAAMALARVDKNLFNLARRLGALTKTGRVSHPKLSGWIFAAEDDDEIPKSR